MERNFGEWRRMNLLYECGGMNVCTIKYQNKQKEWHYATKPLKKNRKMACMATLSASKTFTSRFFILLCFLRIVNTVYVLNMYSCSLSKKRSEGEKGR
jgi:hypothetical protein